MKLPAPVTTLRSQVKAGVGALRKYKDPDVDDFQETSDGSMCFWFMVWPVAKGNVVVSATVYSNLMGVVFKLTGPRIGTLVWISDSTDVAGKRSEWVKATKGYLK